MKAKPLVSVALALVITATGFADPAELTQEAKVEFRFEIGPYPYYYGPYDYYGPYGPYGPCFGPQGYGYGPGLYIGPGCPRYYHGPRFRHHHRRHHRYRHHHRH